MDDLKNQGRQGGGKLAAFAAGPPADLENCKTGRATERESPPVLPMKCCLKS